MAAQVAALEHSSLGIRLKKIDRIFKPNDTVQGAVLVNAYKGWSHVGVKMIVEGAIHTSSATRGVAGIIENVVSTSKPAIVMKNTMVLQPNGKFVDGVTEIPFEFKIEPSGKYLYESYHGAFISIIYTMIVECDRGVMKKGLKKESEFIVEIPTSYYDVPSKKKKDAAPVADAPRSFELTPANIDNLEGSAKNTAAPFKITGRLHAVAFNITQPLTGEVKVEQCETAIETMELQLVRIESVISDSSTQKETTQIQNIQIATGNVCRNVLVPIYMVFPRLFSCPTIRTPVFCVEFEVNLCISFVDGNQVTENFPISIIREA